MIKFRPSFLLAPVLLSIVCVALYAYQGKMWYLLMAKIDGEKSVSDRMRDIESSHPDLRDLAVHAVDLVAIKDPGLLKVYIDKKLWRQFRFTARSGRAGPKLQKGDGQIPEGFYRIDSMNPNSSYYLSLRVSYPNEEDKERSRRNGIRDPGGDIYIHGKEDSIGCLAIGDAAIEQVFYVVGRVDFRSVNVVIAPVDLVDSVSIEGDNADLYRRIRQALSRYKE